MTNRSATGRLSAGLTAAVLLGGGWSAAFPAVANATHLDLSVTAASGTATQIFRVGDVVSERFRVTGLPSSGNDLVLTVTVGTALQVTAVAPSAGGAAYSCGAPSLQSWGGRQVVCDVPAAAGSPLDVTVTASATEAGLTSQFVQLEAQPVGGDATPTSGNVAWTTLRVLEHDLEVVPRSALAQVPRGVTGGSPSDADFYVATTQRVPVQVVLTTDAAGAPLELSDVRLGGPGGTPASCTEEAGVGLICELGTVSPPELHSAGVEVFVPASATVGSTGTVQASVRPVPGHGAGLTTGSAGVDVEVLPHTELSTSLTAGEKDANGAVVVPVGEERAVSLAVSNAGPDTATDVTTTLDVGGFAEAFSFAGFEPAAGLIHTGPRSASWTIDELPPGQSRALDVWLTPVTVPIANDGRPTVESMSWTTSTVGDSATCAAHASGPHYERCSIQLQATPWPGTDGVPGSVDDVNGEGFADAVGIRSDGSLWYYPNELPGGGELPFGFGVRIGQGWQGFLQATTGDVTGDGAADIVATDSAGTLWLYKNGIPGGASPGRPYANGVRIGSGWQGYAQVAAGDVSGDGAADLVATGPDGRLWYYPNNAASNPGGVPFRFGTQIGSGWKGYTHVSAGDVSGDGAADLIATGPDGRLWYFPNNAASNPGRLPYRFGTQIGAGWNGFLAVQAADVTGDGDADLLATAPNGDLRLYENNRLTNPGGLPYRSGERIGTAWNVFRLLL